MFDREDIHLYCPGGYHPVHLGDKFNKNRYVVEHTLGHGGCSTLWLARDVWQDRIVALKIFAATLSDDSCASTEAVFLRQLDPRYQVLGWNWLWCILTSRWESSSTPEFFPILLDEFIIHGPNGIHGCIVTEVLGPSLSFLLNDDERYILPMEASRKIAVQLAQAVAELHGRGIVHGDLHPSNALLCVPGVESWTLDEVHGYLGEPQKVVSATFAIIHRGGFLRPNTFRSILSVTRL